MQFNAFLFVRFPLLRMYTYVYITHMLEGMQQTYRTNGLACKCMYVYNCSVYMTCRLLSFRFVRCSTVSRCYRYPLDFFSLYALVARFHIDTYAATQELVIWVCIYMYALGAWVACCCWCWFAGVSFETCLIHTMIENLFSLAISNIDVFHLFNTTYFVIICLQNALKFYYCVYIYCCSIRWYFALNEYAWYLPVFDDFVDFFNRFSYTRKFAMSSYNFMILSCRLSIWVRFLFILSKILPTFLSSWSSISNKTSHKHHKLFQSIYFNYLFCSICALRHTKKN